MTIREKWCNEDFVERHREDVEKKQSVESSSYRVCRITIGLQAMIENDMTISGYSRLCAVIDGTQPLIRPPSSSCDLKGTLALMHARAGTFTFQPPTISTAK